MNRIKQYKFKNPIWMASSPWTEKFGPIERAIQAGVGGIVLKSISTGIEEVDGKPVRIGKRTVRNVGDYPRLAVQDPYRSGPTIISTASNYDVEILTVNESNNLYRKIKSSYPDVVVIPSFEPRRFEDFDLAQSIEGDFIELNTRAYERAYSRPVNLLDLETSRLMHSEGLRIIEEFQEGIKKISHPIILKLVYEPELDLEGQLSLDVDGFTASDSMKIGRYNRKTKQAIWGKGSFSGGALKGHTLGMVKDLKETFPEKYVSASGGILRPEDAIDVLLVGADSVQLCSAIYEHGFDIISKIVEGVKRINFKKEN